MSTDDQTLSYLTPEFVISAVIQSYGPDEESPGLEWAESAEVESRIQTWVQWFKNTFPSDKDPFGIVNQNDPGKSDFRLYFLAVPSAGARLLRFADACYKAEDILFDEAGTVPEEVKSWRNMDIFCYIRSQDLISRWKRRLCEIEEDFLANYPSQMSNVIKFNDLKTASTIISEAVNDGDFWTEVITTTSEQFGWFQHFQLSNAIEERVRLLQDAQPILASAMANGIARQSNSEGDEGQSYIDATPNN